MIKEFYTVREMSDKFQVKEETIRKKAASGEFDFKPIILPSTGMVFSAKEVESVIDQAAREQHGFKSSRVAV